MNYNIRKATITDLDSILILQNEYEHNLISSSALSNDLQNNLCVYLVAIDAHDNIIGAIGGTNLVDHLDISILITKKELTGQGIASYLLNKLIDFCKTRNINNIFLEVRKSNIPAINLYEKFRFKNISTRKNYYTDNNEDALVYILEI